METMNTQIPELEQCLGSVVRFILDNDADGTHCYFEDIPEAFYVPSVYFPPPYARGEKVTLGSYMNRITFEAQILAGTDWDAQARAAHLRDLIMLNGLRIPKYGPDGTATGKYVNVLEPYQRRIERGIVSLQFAVLDYFAPGISSTPAENIHIAWNGVIKKIIQEVNNGT